MFAKSDAPALLADELGKPGYRCRTILLGANTDPYQPIERDRRLSRRILEVLAAHDHPVAIATKSDLVLRDIDILAPMAERRLAAVGISVTTLDRELARTMEPRAPSAAKRLAALRALGEAGIPTAVMAAPMIPFLNDAELERILEAAAEAGVGSASYILLRLPLEIKDLFKEWLEAHAPGKAKHVLSLIRQCRDGQLYGRRVRHPHERHRALCRVAGPTVPPGLQAAGAQRGAGLGLRARHHPVSPAGAGRGSTGSVRGGPMRRRPPPTFGRRRGSAKRRR